MLRDLLNKIGELRILFKDNRKFNETLLKIFTSKKLFVYGLIGNFAALFFYLIKYNDNNLDISLSRFMSRRAGKLGETTIPTFMRKYVYNGYMKLYNVNKEEILDKNLENYKTIKEFFIRKIDLNLRPIENHSSEVLSSPCDGRILTISEVTNLTDLIIVKDVKYSLTEFLFGKYLENCPQLADNLLNPEKKAYQITIYLSPGDCHRYFSPNNMSISHRVYIPGFLEPVKPSYLDNHPKVFATNERVTLRCNQDGSDNPLFVTYVGALNVGSIKLSFDDFLKTNEKLTKEEKSDPGFYVVKYSDILNPGQSKMEEKEKLFYKPKSPLLFQELEKESQEFDMRDMIDLDLDVIGKYKVNLKDVKLPYSIFRERLLFESVRREKENLNYNMSNSFQSYDVNVHKKKKKLDNPKELNIEKFNVSNQGVHVEKRDEMGWFNFGSTIVLIFTVDKEKEIKFNFKAGEVVKIGQTLFDITNKI